MNSLERVQKVAPPHDMATEVTPPNKDEPKNQTHDEPADRPAESFFRPWRPDGPFPFCRAEHYCQAEYDMPPVMAWGEDPAPEPPPQRVSKRRRAPSFYRSTSSVKRRPATPVVAIGSSGSSQGVRQTLKHAGELCDELDYTALCQI